MDFQKEVIDIQGKVIVDFWAEWCGPCKMLSPILEEIVKEHSDIKIVKIDVDSESTIASQYNIASIPTVMIFDDGKLIDTVVGFHQKNDYLKALL